MTPDRYEYRFGPRPALVRSRREADGPGTLEGYAAVFHDQRDPGTEYGLFEEQGLRVVERIAPGAFDRALAEGDDCRCLLNHNQDVILGRTTSGTLRLAVDRKGLRYSADLPGNSWGRDVAAMLGRADLDGSSFGFIVEQESWVDDGDTVVRIVESARLLDVGPVTFPAYRATEAGLGQRFRAGRRARLPLNAILADVRARAVEVQAALRC